MNRVRTKSAHGRRSRVGGAHGATREVRRAPDDGGVNEPAGGWRETTSKCTAGPRSKQAGKCTAGPETDRTD